MAQEEEIRQKIEQLEEALENPANEYAEEALREELHNLQEKL